MDKEICIRCLCLIMSVLVTLPAGNLVSASEISWAYQIAGEVTGMNLKDNVVTVRGYCRPGYTYYSLSVEQSTMLKEGEKAILLSDIKLGHEVTAIYKEINKTNVAQTIIVRTKPISEACAVTEEAIGKECVNALAQEAAHFSVADLIVIRDGEAQINLILLKASLADNDNSPLLALLRHPDACDIVLASNGIHISAKQKKDNKFPNIYISYSYEEDEESGARSSKDMTYFWNGTRYENSPLKKRMSKEKTKK